MDACSKYKLHPGPPVQGENNFCFVSMDQWSLGDEELPEAALHGVELEELEHSQPLVPPNTAPVASIRSATQETYLQDLERKQRGSRLPLPTDDQAVRHLLRQCNEPITLFAEGPYDRRERLRNLLASNPRLEGVLLKDRGRDYVDKAAAAPADSEEFYVPGSMELVHWRKWLVPYSLSRAKDRLAVELQLRSQDPSVVLALRNRQHERAHSIRLRASQFVSERAVSCCSLSPSNANGSTATAALIATGDFGGSCKLWSSEDLTVVRELEGAHNNASRIGSIQFNPVEMEQLASCDADGKIAVWRLDRPDPLAILTGHTARIAGMAYHPSGRLLGSASFDYSWRLWDLEHSKEIQLQEGHSRGVYSIAFHPDGALVSTGGLDAHGRIWDIRVGKCIWTLQGHLKSILAMEWNPIVPCIATAGEDGTIRLWDLRKMHPLYVIPAHTGPVSRVRYDHKGELLLSSGFDGQGKIWNATGDYGLLASLVAHEGKILGADWNLSSNVDAEQIITAGSDRTLKIWSPLLSVS
jgi:U4/U6 small nuclear ribonucleoprotein PRP4